MNTIKKITYGLEKKYWLNTFLAPVVMIGEVAMETLIPFFMAKIIDVGIEEHNLSYVLRTGGIMIACAFVSLCFGAGGARFSAVASLGFARNLRSRLFNKIQDFSFANMDRFSSASLVTGLQLMLQMFRTYTRCSAGFVSGRRLCLRQEQLWRSG